jgi:hypothetical protein
MHTAKKAFGISGVAYLFTNDWDILQALATGAGKTVAHIAGEDLAENRLHLSATAAARAGSSGQS